MGPPEARVSRDPLSSPPCPSAPSLCALTGREGNEAPGKNKEAEVRGLCGNRADLSGHGGTSFLGHLRVTRGGDGGHISPCSP